MLLYWETQSSLDLSIYAESSGAFIWKPVHIAGADLEPQKLTSLQESKRASESLVFHYIQWFLL